MTGVSMMMLVVGINDDLVLLPIRDTAIPQAQQAAGNQKEESVMTKKERTIKACRELAAKYREPEEKAFFSYPDCPLCLIYFWTELAECKGCPLCDEDGEQGCREFCTYHNARQYESIKTYEARASFFDKIIPILEGTPASRFTKKGWKYFDELDRSW